MKRLRLAILFLIISITLCATEQILIKRTNDQLINDIDNLEFLIKSNDNSNEEIEKFKTDWEKSKLKLKFAASNDLINELEITINSINQNNENNKKALTKVRALINSIYENNKLSWSNIL